MKDKLEMEIKNMMYHYFEDKIKEYISSNVDAFTIKYRCSGGKNTVDLWTLLTQILDYLKLEVQITPEKTELVKIKKIGEH